MSCRLLIDYCCVLVRAGFLTNVDVVIIFCDLRLWAIWSLYSIIFSVFANDIESSRNVEICQKIRSSARTASRRMSS